MTSGAGLLKIGPGEMTFLPIVQRELRVAARRRATYWTRLGIALLATGMGAVIFLVTLGTVSPQQTGQFIFRGLAGLLLVYGLGYGRRATADCLSSEKREGTLGLLFLTDLKGVDVVLGKLTATSLGGFYGLLAVLPVLAVCLLLGGITNGEFWRMVLVLLDTFLLSLAIGMLGSALTRDFRRAMAANFLLLLLIVGALPAGALAVAYFLPAIGLVPELLFCSPFYGFYLSFDGPYKAESVHFWSAVIMMQGLAWVLILLASSAVPRSWHDRPLQAKPKGWRELWHRWNYGRNAEYGEYRRRLLDANAFYWLAARERLKPLHVWTFLACMGGWWFVGWAASGHYWLDEAQFLLTAGLLNFALKVWVTIEAGQELADDQKSGAVELLLSVPLTVNDILQGQLLALKRQFLKPLFVVIGLECVFAAVVYAHAREARVLAMWGAGLVMLVLDILALTWVAMARALTSRSHNQATISTLLRVLVLPWVLFGLVMAVGNAWSSLTQATVWSPDWPFNLGLWFGLGLGADLLFGSLAWRQVHYDFREMALRRFERGPGAAAAATRESPVKASASPEPEVTTPTHVKPSAPPRVRRKRRRIWALSGAIFLLVVALLALPRSRDPAPPAVTLGPQKGPLRALRVGQGLAIILPDGSLWRWGITGVGRPSAFPEAVDTNRDWVQISIGGAHCVGLRNDGTIWEWGATFYLWGAGPVQVGSGRDWVSIGAAPNYAVAIRRDGTLWAWGRNGANTLSGVQLNLTNLVQVGTENDWSAVEAGWNSMYALRRDGTLWVWGRPFYFGGAGVPAKSYLTPTRVCSNTNWTGFDMGLTPQAWTGSGELWDLSFAAPAPELPAEFSCRLALTNSSPGKAVTAFLGSPKLYQVRPDGTLWVRDYSYGSRPGASGTVWHRVGRRADWVSVGGAGGTALGLTADGTLWTWGLDPGRQVAPDFWSKLRFARARLSAWIGGGPGAAARMGRMPAFQSEPRPLMKLIGQGTSP